MKLEPFINDNRNQLKKRLSEKLDEEFQRLGDAPFASEVSESFGRISKNGKMVRSLLVLLLAHDSGSFSKSVIDVALSLELFHLGLLVHDDIMDNDSTRRGEKTIHTFYTDKVEGLDKQSSEEYGRAFGICIGDLSFFLPIRIITDTSISAEKKVQIIQRISEELLFTGLAQIADVHFGKTSDEPTEKEIFSLYVNKTSRYSFSLPLAIGSILHGDDITVQQQLCTLGHELGLLYQIRDDELSLFGNLEKTGKTPGSDIKENKKTIFRNLLLHQSKGEEKQKLQGIFGRKDISSDDIAFVQKLLIESGVLKQVNKKRELLVKRATKILSEIHIDDEKKEALRDLISYCYNRNA